MYNPDFLKLLICLLEMEIMLEKYYYCFFLLVVCDSREFHKDVVFKLMIRYSVIKNPVNPPEQEVHSKSAVLKLLKSIYSTVHFLFCQTFGNILRYILEVKHHGRESKFFV